MELFKKKFKMLTLAGAITLGMASTAMSAETVPPQLNNLIESGTIKLVETFQHDSFTGWLVANGSEYHLYWSTKDNYVVAGPLIDETGINLTSKYLEAKKPTPNYNEAYAKLEKEGTYTTTKVDPKAESKGLIYVFAEPFCGWCSKLHDQLQPHIAAGLEVRWVHVSFLSAQSPDVIENILKSDSPIATLDEHEQIRKNHGQPKTRPATNETRRAIERNSELMNEFGIRGTPGVVYKLDGKTHVGGYMKSNDLDQLIKSIEIDHSKSVK